MKKIDDDPIVTLTKKELNGIILALEHLLNVTQDNHKTGSFERIRAVEAIKKLKNK